MFLAHHQSFSSSRQHIPSWKLPCSILCFGFILHWIETALTWVLSLSLSRKSCCIVNGSRKAEIYVEICENNLIQYEVKRERHDKRCKWFCSGTTRHSFQSHPSIKHSFSRDWPGIDPLVRHFELMLITSPGNHCRAYGTLVGISFAIIY